jgi:hypothetical protein
LSGKGGYKIWNAPVGASLPAGRQAPASFHGIFDAAGLGIEGSPGSQFLIPINLLSQKNHFLHFLVITRHQLVVVDSTCQIPSVEGVNMVALI